MSTLSKNKKTIKFPTGTYNGTVKPGTKIRHGIGIMTYDEDDEDEGEEDYLEYNGNWVDDHIEGKGKMEYNQELTEESGYREYDGDWSYYPDLGGISEPNGKGKMTYVTDEVYEGDWVRGQPHGKGKWTYPEYDDDHEEGAVIWEEDGEKGYLEYEGDFSHGQKHGAGRMVFQDGRVYEGNWVFGVMTGEGTMYFDDCDDDDNPEGYSRYIGEFEEGMRDGFGIMQFLDGRRYYEGDWGEDLPLDEVEGEVEGEVEDEDENQNRNEAVEIHRAAAKINLVKYLELIEITPDYGNIIEYVKSLFIPYISDNFVEEREQMIQKLNSILSKISQTLTQDVSKRNLIGKTVDFVFKQSKQFIDFYIKTIIQDCYHAYTGEHGMSCVNGILERFYMIVGDSVFAVCPDGDCDNPVYKELLELFNKHIDKNALTQEWTNLFLGSEELKQMNKDQRKDHYINFMRQKYMAADMLDEHTEMIIREEALALEEALVFDKLEFGGKKRKRSTKKGVKKIKRKTNKKNKKPYKN